MKNTMIKYDSLMDFNRYAILDDASYSVNERGNMVVLMTTISIEFCGTGVVNGTDGNVEVTVYNADRNYGSIQELVKDVENTIKEKYHHNRVFNIIKHFYGAENMKELKNMYGSRFMQIYLNISTYVREHED